MDMDMKSFWYWCISLNNTAIYIEYELLKSLDLYAFQHTKKLYFKKFGERRWKFKGSNSVK